MAIIKNVFRRKKKLADTDGNQQSPDEEAFGDEVKRQDEEEEARKTDNSSTSDNLADSELNNSQSSFGRGSAGGGHPGIGRMARPSRRDLRAGMAEDLEAERLQQTGAVLLAGNKRDTTVVRAPKADQSKQGGEDEGIGFEIEITIQPEPPREARRRATSRDRGSRNRARSSSRDALRAVRARSQERRTKRGGKDALASSRHDSLATSRHSTEGLDTSGSGLKEAPSTSEVSETSADKTDQAAMNTSNLSTSRHRSAAMSTSKHNDGLATSRHSKGDAAPRNEDGHKQTGELRRSRHRSRDPTARSSSKMRSRSSDKLTSTSSSGDRVRSASRERRRRRREERGSSAKVEGDGTNNSEPAEKEVVESADKVAVQPAETVVLSPAEKAEVQPAETVALPPAEKAEVQPAETVALPSAESAAVEPVEKGVNHGKETAEPQKFEEAKKVQPSSDAPAKETERRRARRSSSRDATRSRRSDSKERSGSTGRRSSSRDGRRPRTSHGDSAPSESAEKTAENAQARRSSSRDGRRPRTSHGDSAPSESAEKTAENAPARRSSSRDGRRPRTSHGDSTPSESAEKTAENAPARRSSSRDGRRPRSSHGDSTPSESAEKTAENTPARRSSSRDRRPRRSGRKPVDENGVEPGKPDGSLQAVENTSTPAVVSSAEGGTDTITKANTSDSKDAESEPNTTGVQKKLKVKEEEQLQNQGRKAQVVFHEDEEKKAIDAKKAQEVKEFVVEINPAHALLSLLGGGDSGDQTKKSGSDPSAEALKSSFDEGQQISVAESASIKSQVQDDDKCGSAADEASDIESIKEAPSSSPRDVPNPAVKADEKAVEAGKVGTDLPVENERRRSKKSEKTAVPKTANAVADLLGFLGSNYDEIISMDDKDSAPNAFDLLASDQPENSVDFYKGISSTTSTGQSGGNGDSGDDYVKSADRFNDSFGEGEKRLPPPSVAPSAIMDTEKQKARRARRIARMNKEASAVDNEVNKTSTLAPPSLAGDMHRLMRTRKPKTESDESKTRGVQRSKSDEGPCLQSMVEEEDEVKKPQSMRRPIRRTTDGENSNDDVCAESLAPPSLAPMAKPRSNLVPMDSFEEDTRRKVSRKEVRKAKKFASLDEDDDSDSVEIVVTETAPAEKAKSRRGLLSKATSVTNMMGKTGKIVAKKAASTRKLFG